MQSAPGAVRDARQITRRFDFSRGTGGVLASCTHCDLLTWDLRFLLEIRDLPPEVKVSSRNRRAHYASSNNRPDEIFMVLRAPIKREHSIDPGATCKWSLRVELATNSPNCAGAGGSESNLYRKA